jgi:hypothetical protein
VLLGIDENTALVGRIGGEWTVMGTGRLHHITRGAEKLYSAGERVRLEAPAREPS